jgi:hypothetical protein
VIATVFLLITRLFTVTVGVTTQHFEAVKWNVRITVARTLISRAVQSTAAMLNPVRVQVWMNAAAA